MAALQGDKGKDLMMNSSAAEKMKDDPRFRAAMGLNWTKHADTNTNEVLKNNNFFLPN